MNKGSLRISMKNFSVEGSDNFVYRLTNRFFYLYVYLAYRRSRQGENDSGFVEREQIHHLPFWEKNSLESIGKQIRRHVIKMMGKNVIEAQQKIKGPYRLMIDPKNIHFDVDSQVIREHLRLDKLAVYYPEKEGNTFHEYIRAITKGDIHLNEGIVKRAWDSFQQALDQSTTVEHRIIALQRLGKTRERMGDYREALKLFREAIVLIKKKAKADYYNLACIYNNQAWLYHRMNKFKAAEKTYYQVLNMIRGKTHNDLLGKVHNGLGIIYGSEGKYDEALASFKNALALTCVESDFYGVSAAYFNIGNIYRKKADEIAKKENSSLIKLLWQAEDFYSQAIMWAKKCIDLTARAGVGDDTSQDRILVSYCYYMLGKYNESLEYAREAEKMATTAGNKRDIALSCKMIGKILWTTGKEGNKNNAKEYFTKSIEYFQKIGDKSQASKLKNEIEQTFKLTKPR